MKTKTKKNLLAMAAAAVSIAALLASASCGKEKAPSEVNVYNWGEYIDESIFADFEAETGIAVNYTTFQTNEEMYAAMKLGGTSYDVIIPSDYTVGRMISEGMLEKLDFGNIPNMELIAPERLAPAYDPTGEYSVPYMWGTVGLIYNSSMIDEELTSWGALFDPAYFGQILMFDNPRDAFGIALKYLGYSLNTTSEAELRLAYDLLTEQKPILQAYVMDKIFDKLEVGEAAIGPYYAGDYLTMREQNPDLRFALPDEGSNIFTDAMCVPKGAANKENAEKFINFMTGTDVSIANMDVTGYTSPNAEAAEIYGADLDAEGYAVMFPPTETLGRCEPFLNLPQETLDLYDALWVELKS
jgi:spermidine/putrescine transport system substrate-binding protein